MSRLLSVKTTRSQNQRNILNSRNSRYPGRMRVGNKTGEQGKARRRGKSGRAAGAPALPGSPEGSALSGICRSGRGHQSS